MNDAPEHLRQQVQGLLEAGNVDALLAAIYEVLESHPMDPWLLHLGAIHETSRGNYQTALQLFKRVLDVLPDDAQVHYNCGTLLQQLGLNDLARAHLERCVELKPDYPQALSNLGALLIAYGDLDGALSHLSRAVQLQPENINTVTNLATALRDLGRLEESLELYDAAVEASPTSMPVAESNRLLAYNYSDAIDDETLCGKHIEWAQKWQGLVPLTPEVRPSRGRDERLRIGYVSADFHRHSVAFFIEGILEMHDRDRFRIHGYSAGRQSDEVTTRLQGLCDSWLDICNLDDAAVAQQIADEEIDILVDLSGHTAHNRLGVFARKPAAVQVTYLGYGTTTGLAEMDYRITDAFADPPEFAWHGSEQLIRLPSGFQSYLPSRQLPEVTPPPSLTGDGVTFGSFNMLPKLGTEVFREWAAILRELPGARLMLKARQLASELARQRILELFAEQGVARERLILHSHVNSFTEHIALYQQVDIGLDPFPYNGATTTCEALSMGVPVITLRGDRHVGRMGASILSRVGLDDLVAESLEEYRQLAVSLASDSERLKTLRETTRDRMMASSLTDTATLTHELEDAFLKMWDAAGSR